MSAGSDPKNPAAPTEAVPAAPNPLIGMWEQFGQSWATSLGIL